jgi:hypothetical protein
LPKELLAHFAHKGVDTGYKKERSKRSWKRDGGSSSYPSDTFALKEGRKGTRHYNNSFLPRHPLHRGGDWSRLPSPTTSPPCQGKNLPNEKLGDEGIDAGIFGDITKLGSRTQHNPYLEMKSRKWEKLPTSGYSEKGGILADVTVGKLKTEIKNKLNRVQGYAERTLSLLET